MAVWNFENAAHLLQRAAFGGTPEEIQAFLGAHASVADAVESLINFPVSGKKPPKGGRDFYQAKLKQQRWWLKTMLRTRSARDALREKLVLFWHNHLVSGFSKQPDSGYTSVQNGLLRRYANGNFRDLVRAFNRDPANLRYLDGILNYASNDGIHVSANENFGREVMELFTLGIKQFASDGSDDPAKPNYTEQDVHQLARALTGWVEVHKDLGQWQSWAWDGGQYDDDGDDLPDPITIFGVTNPNFRIDDEVAGTADDVLQLIFSRVDDAGNNQVGMFMARKLWTWFAYPAPAPGLKALLAGFASTFASGQFEMVPLLRAIFNSEEFYSDLAKSRSVKNPVDYMIGSIRAFGLKSNGRTIGYSDELVSMLSEMGMDLFEPPNVAGWPGGKRWITTGTLVARLDFARFVAESDFGATRIRLSDIEGMPIGDATADPNAVIDSILVQLGLDGSQGGVALTSLQRDALVDFVTAGGTLAALDLTNESTGHAVYLVRGAIALALQSAEFQIF
ncbi:MAG: DUF1800 domain-containing protein [Deltaproteobacteria bacterium]|nr:DUF1800 domain-containing protein [Deltaproteobacteria bacterium]